MKHHPRDREDGKKHWYYLSFADGGRPEGEQFLGACYVQGYDFFSAVIETHRRRINPGGEVMVACLEGIEHLMDKVVPEARRNRLLTKEELGPFDDDTWGKPRMSKFECKRCVARENWRGSDPKCGFDADGNFLRENWNCATLNAIRDVTRSPHEMDEYGLGAHLRHEDENVAVLPMPDKPDGRAGDFMLVRWYKNRGRTDSVLIWEGSFPRLVTLAEVEYALESWGKREWLR